MNHPIKLKSDSINIICKVNNGGSEEGFSCDYAYYEFTKEILLKLFELKKLLKVVSKHEVRYLPVVLVTPYWVTTFTELENLEKTINTQECCGITEISQKLLEDNEISIEYDETHIYKDGVLIKGFFKDTSIEVSTPSFSWEFLKECLTNCEPKSIQFIKDSKK